MEVLDREIKNTKKSQFNKKVDNMFNSFEKTLDLKLNIVTFGKVSAGKSSFLNAFFDREKNKPLFSVNAKSGETTKVKSEKLGSNILVGDTPGLNDINKDNSQESKKILEEGIDVGILVLSGSADSSQKEHYDDLLKNSNKVFIVLNKADNFSKENINSVINQWKEQLELDDNSTIYPVVSRGYDSNDMEKFRGKEYAIEIDEYGRPATLEGIDKVRNDVLSFLEESGKDLLLAKELKDKSNKALAIILAATVLAAGQSFIPGSSAYIVGTQTVAIASLSYLYTGKSIPKKAAIGLIGTLAAEQVGLSLFLVAKSFLPPTGAIDLAAAVIATIVTASMLSAVAYLLKNEIDLMDKLALKKSYNEIFKSYKNETKNVNKKDLLTKEYWKSLIKKYL